MCSTGAITPECSPALVLGANTGSCVLELLGASRQGTEARRVRTGNTLFRIIIAALALLLMLKGDITIHSDNVEDHYRRAGSASDAVYCEASAARRSALCTLTCARLSQLSGLLSSIEKKALLLRFQDPLPEKKLICVSRLSLSCQMTLEYALHAFSYRGDNVDKSFDRSLAEFISQLDDASTSQFSQKISSEAGESTRMVMLELIGQFRQFSLLLFFSNMSPDTLP